MRISIYRLFRKSYRVKHLVSNIELFIRIFILRNNIVFYDALNHFSLAESQGALTRNSFYSVVHVKLGHIPTPIIKDFLIKNIKFVYTGNNYNECVSV